MSSRDQKSAERPPNQQISGVGPVPLCARNTSKQSSAPTLGEEHAPTRFSHEEQLPTDVSMLHSIFRQNAAGFASLVREETLRIRHHTTDTCLSLARSRDKLISDHHHVAGSQKNNVWNGSFPVRSAANNVAGLLRSGGYGPPRAHSAGAKQRARRSEERRCGSEPPPKRAPGGVAPGKRKAPFRICCNKV